MPAGQILTIAVALVATRAARGDSPPATLALEQDGGSFTITHGGSTGIPSWKVVIRQDNAGNISALHVPADSPYQLSAREGQWPLGVIGTSNVSGVEGTMSRGRENFAAFRVPTFELVKQSDARIEIRVGGPSKNKHYEHHRTYVLTPAGIQIEGSVQPFIDLKSIGISMHWNRTLLADVSIPVLAARKQGRLGWVYVPSRGTDSSSELPWPAHFPMDVQLKLRQPQSTYVNTHFDQNFEANAGKHKFVHNNKDSLVGRPRRLQYEKYVAMPAGPVPTGVTQTYQVRLTFETRPAQVGLRSPADETCRVTTPPP